MDADLATGSDGTDPASVKEQKMSESIAEIKKQLSRTITLQGPEHCLRKQSVVFMALAAAKKK